MQLLDVLSTYQGQGAQNPVPGGMLISSLD